ncbi:hypothetical protein DR094_01315 [Mycoplasma flocculare]|uniref:YrdC-like domain-containing protein n=1 Tax=Mesomycoplasma flocculare TaxID=2128 RepID=A0AAW9X9T0_MESFC|nr:hypothetical protein [Mesomycoplasma flocculare]MXR12219.1 hypothetical protein [Mesomycoplasma flocculare]MXR39646.1 hypothetical protein [Mycoplasma sp. MF12]MXR56633.1 hypothetical protein [Mesomycoplasma flocculare]
MKVEIKLTNKVKNSFLSFSFKNKKKIRIKIPIFIVFFRIKTSKYLNFRLSVNLKLKYFKNFLLWLSSENLIAKNQVFQEKVAKNKVFCLKLANNLHILLWKYDFEKALICIENNEDFTNWFDKNFRVFETEIEKYSKLFLCTTDTVPGIGSFYENLDFMALFAIKNRDFSKKIVTLVANLGQIKPLITKKNYQKLKKISKNFWPGATTLIIEGQSFRIPNQLPLLEILKKNGPAFVTSANISNQKLLNFVAARKKFWQICKIFNFQEGSGKPSKIYDIDTKKWIRK